MVEILVEVGSR